MRRSVYILAAAMAPAALVALLLIGYDYYERERTRLIRDSMGTARALSAAVDTELTAARAALFALATSPYIAAGDMAAFDAQARSALKNLQLLNIILTERSGRQRINTFRPYGAPLATSDPSGLLRVFETGEPAVSNLFAGPVVKMNIIGVGVPVRLDGDIRYGLAAGVSPEHVSALLAQEKLPPGWIAVVLDRSGTIVARTHDAARWVGQKGSSELVRRLHEVSEDAFDSRTVEGIPVLTVFNRSAVSGWTVAIGIPISDLVRELIYSLARLFIVGFTAFLIALGIAVWMERRFEVDQRQPGRRA